MTKGNERLKQLKRILTDLHFNAGVNKIILKIFRERERMVTCLRFYVLYIISVSSGRRKGDNGKQCAMKSRLQLKSFPSPASVGNRALDSFIIKPALNPHSATGRMERQRDRATANQRDGQRERERETERQRGRGENSFTYTAATSLLNFSNQLFCS